MVLEGFTMVFTSPMCILLIFTGVIVGIIFGAMPGLSSTMALVLFLPLSFGMTPIHGLSLLIGLYTGGMSGGLISAILLKIPGTPASLATVWDGAPMAEKGEAGKALGIGILYSFIGGTLGIIALIFIAPSLAKLALKFTAFEYFSVSLFSLTIIASLAGKSMINGIISGLLGVLVALIGASPIDGYLRLTFGNHNLDNGADVVSLLIGFFAIAEIIKYGFKKSEDKMRPQNYTMKGFGISIQEFRSQIRNMITAALVGVGIGILPGVGGNTSGMISYSLAKNSSKYPEKFGTGIIDGVVASETSNNAVIGGSLIPLLCLGIPGNTVAAVLLGGMTIHGIAPGPLIFDKCGDVIYGIFFALIIANFAMLFFEFFGIRVFVRLLDIPKYYLLPVIMSLCVVGAFASNSRTFDVLCIFIFGVLAYIFSKLDIPTSPFIIGYVLGMMTEENYRRAMIMSEGNMLPFITRPISLFFVAVALYSLSRSIIKSLKHSREEGED